MSMWQVGGVRLKDSKFDLLNLSNIFLFLTNIFMFWNISPPASVCVYSALGWLAEPGQSLADISSLRPGRMEEAGWLEVDRLVHSGSETPALLRHKDTAQAQGMKGSLSLLHKT